MSENPTIKKAAVAGALFFLSCGAYYFLHTATLGNHMKIATLREENASIASTEEAVRSMKNLVKDTKDERQELESQLLARTDPTPFLGLLEDLAQDTGVQVEVSSLTEATLDHASVEPLHGGVGLPPVRAVLEVDGAFAQVHHFITLLELIPYALSLERVAVERSQEGAGWSAVIMMSIFTR
jgi:hypothetical protein